MSARFLGGQARDFDIASSLSLTNNKIHRLFTDVLWARWSLLRGSRDEPPCASDGAVRRQLDDVRSNVSDIDSDSTLHDDMAAHQKYAAAGRRFRRRPQETAVRTIETRIADLNSEAEEASPPRTASEPFARAGSVRRQGASEPFRAAASTTAVFSAPIVATSYARFMLEGRGRMIAAETPFICSIPDFSS
jgi:hypothetical protein